MKAAPSSREAGLAAGLIGIPLLSFGKTPAAVTVFLLIFTFLMLITGATLLDLIRSAYKPVQKIGETYVERVEERRRPQFNIDVPLDEDPLPAHPVRVEEQSEQSRETVKKAKEKLIQAGGGGRRRDRILPRRLMRKSRRKKQRRNRRCWTIWWGKLRKASWPRPSPRRICRRPQRAARQRRRRRMKGRSPQKNLQRKPAPTKKSPGNWMRQSSCNPRKVTYSPRCIC